MRAPSLPGADATKIVGVVEQYDVTSVGVNPAQDRAHRMHVYFVAMTVRIICVGSLFFVRGWWILLVGLAAVILPYFAVLVANQHAPGTGERPEPPTPLELTGGTAAVEHSREDPAASMLLVVDEPAERRSNSSNSSNAADSAGSGSSETGSNGPGSSGIGETGSPVEGDA